ncbi:MAG: hypothetical protein CM1200mP4_2390 [Rhodospirillaceae bacterium]|nr:MAG: hypothetical protein CM1200mP4_2390 [Rhodospirillaceae bacterium]
MEHFEESLQSLKKGFELATDFPEGHNEIGAVLRDLERPEEALKSLETALTLRPDLLKPIATWEAHMLISVTWTGPS